MQTICTVIFIDQRSSINIIYNDVKIAIIIKISICSSIRKSLLIILNCISNILKLQIIFVQKEFILEFDLWEFFNDLHFFLRHLTRTDFRLNIIIRNKIHIIDIIQSSWYAIRYKKIFLAIVIKIHPQRRPRPISCVNTCINTYFTECTIASVVLQIVSGILMVIAITQFHVE